MLPPRLTVAPLCIVASVLVWVSCSDSNTGSDSTSDATASDTSETLQQDSVGSDSVSSTDIGDTSSDSGDDLDGLDAPPDDAALDTGNDVGDVPSDEGGGEVGGDALDSNGEPDLEAGPLVIGAMTFNIRYGLANDGDDSWFLRTGLVFDLVDTHGRDFIGLQEALFFQTNLIVDAVDRYTQIGDTRTGDNTGEACHILYDANRWELDVDETGTFWLSETPEEVGSVGWDAALPRIATWGRFIERTSGRAVYVFNTHFDHRGSEARLKSAELIAQRVAAREHPEDPVVVMGDFNATPGSGPLDALVGEGADAMLADTYLLVHPEPTEDGTFHGFDGNTDGNRIDFVLVSDNTTVLEAEILHDNEEGRYPSDHFPVRIEWRAYDSPE